MSTTVTNPTSRARYTFSHLNNSLYCNDESAEGYAAELIELLKDPEMNKLVILEMFAQWEQMMACSDADVAQRYANLSQALREGAAMYLAIIPQ